MDEAAMIIASPYKGGCKNGLADGHGTYKYSIDQAKGSSAISTVTGEFLNGKLNGDVTIDIAYQTGASSTSKLKFL